MIWFDVAEELLPPVYKAIKDMYAYAKSLNTEFLNWVSYLERILNNFFIQRCSLQTLEYWEDLLDISLDGDETIEERRIKVLEYLNNIYPTSEPYVRSVIERMFPEEEYHLWFDVENNNPFDLNIDIFTTNIAELNKFKEWMRKMCPAHIYQIISKAMRTHFDRPAIVNNANFSATWSTLGLVEKVVPDSILFYTINKTTGEETAGNEEVIAELVQKDNAMFSNTKQCINIPDSANIRSVAKDNAMFNNTKQAKVVDFGQNLIFTISNTPVT